MTEQAHLVVEDDDLGINLLHDVVHNGDESYFNYQEDDPTYEPEFPVEYAI